MATTLTYTKSAFTPFTKIVSADVNTYFSDIKSRVNWAGGTSATTGLGDDNIQSNAASGGGLTRSTKLKAGTANYVLINDSSGNMSQEQRLNVSRGGTGSDLSGATTGYVPVFNGTVYANAQLTATAVTAGTLTSNEISASAGLNPAGTILAYGGASAPTGYLICDGSSVLRATYAALFTAISTAYGSADGTHFNLPDCRGQFLRGVDGAAGRDADKASRTANASGGATGNNVGSVQGYQVQSHSHTFTIYSGSGTPGNTVPEGDDSISGGNGFTTNSTGGSETRPTNVYVNYIIKT